VRSSAGSALPDVQHRPAAVRFREPSIERALSRVGATVPALEELLGSLLDAGPAYVVGSLAAGLGNGGSDIDINVMAERKTQEAPMMFFLDSTCVDLQYYDAAEPGRVAAGLHADSVELAGARCMLGAAPALKSQKRISRWMTACPFDEDDPPVFDPGTLGSLHAALVRGAVEALVLRAFLAWALEPAGARARIAYRRAGRAVVEVLTRAAGDLFIGEKWLVARAARAGIDDDVAAAAFATGSRAELEQVLSGSGLGALAAPDLVTLERSSDIEEVRVGAEAWTLLSGARVVRGGASQYDPERLRARRDRALADALAEGAVAPSIDHRALDEAVSACAA
jgi:hypothetical protein